MANTKLWDAIKELKTEKYKWVDLTHELSPETPHWYGFKPLGIEKLFDYPEAPMRVAVINKSKEVEENNDYVLTADDLKTWEAENGRIPEGSFVAFRSDWYKRSPEVFDNYDENKIPHYPGWDLDAIKWLVEERNIGAIGHETADTDPGFITSNENNYPYPGEKYILDQDRIQIELLTNLDKIPATGALIVCTFPKLKGGTGYPARCFAIVPV